MAIELSKVEYSYTKGKHKKNVLENINLKIENNNEFIAIVGHTGSGKSTLVQLLNSLLLPSKGRINISWEGNSSHEYKINAEGKKIKIGSLNKKGQLKYHKNVRLKALRKHIGLVFQFPEYQLFEETVLKDIMFGPLNFSKNKEESKKRALEVAKLMGIEDLLDKSPFVLSGGQMRKVAIAGILASDPKVLVLDEPTVGLDPLAKHELLEFLKYLNEEKNRTIIIITHDMDTVSQYAKRCVVLKKGRIEFDGSKEDMFKNNDVIENCNLSYPSIMNIMIKLKEQLNIDLDIHKYTVEEAFQEIKDKEGTL